uniref:Tubulin/FtsZ GTPase domain-containing protein n=1 Tax=Cuerna arida TaxID=1464854 RepID=A0A1B6F235_9HEMI
MSEFITVQVGQCGNQIGSVFWPQVLEEYGITSSNSHSTPSKIDKSFKSFFDCSESLPKACRSATELRRSKVTARALLVDMEEKVVDRFHHGSLHHLFDKKCFVTNHPGSGNNWAVGHHTHFDSHRSALEDKLRNMAEKCDCLCGVLVLLSLGGGTGAGLGTAIVRLLEDQFPLVDRSDS